MDMKYSRDGPAYKSVGDLAREVCTKIKAGEKYREYLDQEFFFGAWGHVFEKMSEGDSALMRRDIGSLIKFAFLKDD